MPSRGKCQECGRVTHGAKRCAECYQNRGSGPPRVRIGQCGHPMSRHDGKTCRACYDQRGRKPKAVNLASICGHPAPAHGAKYCRACYDSHRKELSTAAAVSPSVTVESP